jgi:hypothetical protein
MDRVRDALDEHDGAVDGMPKSIAPSNQVRRQQSPTNDDRDGNRER